MPPSKYTPEILESIVERLSSGEPMAQICRDKDMPAYSTVADWISSKPEVSVAIARAREVGEDVIAANLRQIARGTSPESTNDVQRDKLIIYTDLQLLAKWNPKKYGDRQALDVEVKDGLTKEQRDAVIAATIGTKS
jgi:hypothetical protein